MSRLERTEEAVKDEVQGREGEKGPDLASEKGRRAFIRILNSRLPKKRVIAQGVLRTEDDEVLLCELVYKKDWDLPGGVVDPGESPADCVVREVREELGLDVTVQGLLAVNWLPPYRGWDDALLVLFDLGEVDRSFVDGAVYQRREIKGAHWAGDEVIAEKVAPYTARMLAEVARGRREETAYLENSQEPG
jgi:8-oxo-dGTP diphosphatase